MGIGYSMFKEGLSNGQGQTVLADVQRVGLSLCRRNILPDFLHERDLTVNHCHQDGDKDYPIAHILLSF